MVSNNRCRWALLLVLALVIVSPGCGKGVGTPVKASPIPAPVPSATSSPTPKPAAEDPPPEPSPEETSEEPAVVEITDLILGVSAKGYAHYAMGSTAAMGGSEPYFFINPDACRMKLEVYTLPTSALPGATALEGLQVIYQQNYVEQSSSSVSWTITQEPFELELNGESSARLETERLQNERISLFQITVIRSQTRSAIVQGQISKSCAANPASLAYLNEMTDSVMLHDPAPLCYVGFKPGSDPAEYGVSCDYERTGWLGQVALADGGFTQIELGPVTWDECAEFMRAHDQDFWR